jgi:radical SAM protein with 4Fe4S-binding SPASM domain
MTNYYVVVLCNDPNVSQYWKTGKDTTAINFDFYHSDAMIVTAKKQSMYQYNSTDLVNAVDLTAREEFLLNESKTFCIYPWVHLHAYPTGEAYPCCQSEMKVGQIGNCRTSKLKEIWNSDKQKQLRQDMLNETPNPTCGRCYEQEDSGFFSGRKSANKHHGHNIKRVLETNEDGSLDRFEMTYWDIRFSNLCNLKCRSCGHIFSSQWYQDQAKLAGGDWKQQNSVLNYAGRTELDMWEQLEPHLDYVEQIYFAGGEPLLMEEHYRILEELVQRKLFHVRLIYNTNFTHTELKGKSVFEYWAV